MDEDGVITCFAFAIDNSIRQKICLEHTCGRGYDKRYGFQNATTNMDPNANKFKHRFATSSAGKVSFLNAQRDGLHYKQTSTRRKVSTSAHLCHVSSFNGTLGTMISTPSYTELISNEHFWTGVSFHRSRVGTRFWAPFKSASTSSPRRMRQDR